MAAPRVGEQLVVQDPLEGPEQDSGQVAQKSQATSKSEFRTKEIRIHTTRSHPHKSNHNFLVNCAIKYMRTIIIVCIG
jgi:hypothetical protein